MIFHMYSIYTPGIVVVRRWPIGVGGVGLGDRLSWGMQGLVYSFFDGRDKESPAGEQQ